MSIKVSDLDIVVRKELQNYFRSYAFEKADGALPESVEVFKRVMIDEALLGADEVVKNYYGEVFDENIEISITVEEYSSIFLGK